MKKRNTIFLAKKNFFSLLILLLLLIFGWFTLGKEIISEKFMEIAGLGSTTKKVNLADQNLPPCSENKAIGISPYETHTLSSGCVPAQSNLMETAAPQIIVVPTDSNYQSTRKLRAEKTVEGLKKGEVVAAADTVFASKLCSGLKQAGRKINLCDETDTSLKQAFNVLKSESEKGDVAASFALARALALDNSPGSRQQAINVLQAIPEKSPDMSAFLQYLKTNEN